jgi:murein DD-endopeptidase / murein LD-carboxypeptidase
MVSPENIRNNLLIMKMILVFTAFPLVFFLFSPQDINPDVPLYENIFDTTQITGYSFFRENGIEITPENNIAFFNALYPLMGTPHRIRAGRDGLDCSGLVKKLYNEVFGTNLKGASRDIFRQTNEILVEDLREADLIFFKINSNQINHIGIYLGNNKFVHSSSVSGVVINDFLKDYYQTHFYKAGRLNFQ